MSCEEATDDMYVGDCGEDSVNQSEAYSSEMPLDDTRQQEMKINMMLPSPTRKRQWRKVLMPVSFFVLHSNCTCKCNFLMVCFVVRVFFFLISKIFEDKLKLDVRLPCWRYNNGWRVRFRQARLDSLSNDNHSVSVLFTWHYFRWDHPSNITL